MAPELEAVATGAEEAEGASGSQWELDKRLGDVGADGAFNSVVTEGSLMTPTGGITEDPDRPDPTGGITDDPEAAMAAPMA